MPTSYTPVIDAQPQGLAFMVGDSKILTVAASTTPAGGTLSYQWKKNGIDIAEKNASSLMIGDMVLTDAGSYTVSISCGANTVLSGAAVLICDSVVSAVVRNRKTALEAISETAGACFTPDVVEEERLTLNINGRYPYGLLLKAPIEPTEEDNKRDDTEINFMICWFFLYNDDDENLEEITYKYRNVVADTVMAWMQDRTCGGLMEGTHLVGSDQGIAQDSKGNLFYRVDICFTVHGFIDSDNPYLKG